MKIFNNKEDAVKEYNNYILQHKHNVIKSWNKIQIKLYNHPFVKDKYINWYITKLCNTHDDSKYSIEEFEPYRKYFYPTTEDIDKDIIQKEYDDAWVHHYTHNPHHWEYWANYDENKERETLRFIREAYIVERVCDWMAMSIFQEGHDNCLEWYYNNKKEMVMIPDDERFLETVLHNMFK